MSAASAAPSRKLPYIDPAGFTPHFAWRTLSGARCTERVFCESLDLTQAAKEFGTPTYVYSSAAIDEAYKQLDRGLGKLPHTICFAVKANGNLSILDRLAKLGSGFDIVSGGELEHLALIGAPANRIVFSGVGKTRDEIRAALGYLPSQCDRKSSAETRGILLFNVESEEELELLQEEAEHHVARGGRVPGLAIRVNPDVQAGGHPKIATGRHHHKFGLDWSAAKRLYLAHKNSRVLRWQGISAHIGSQIVSLKPFQQAFGRIAGYVKELRAAGIELEYLDLGGGLGVRYTDEKVPPREEYARMVARVAQSLGLHLLLEPGRSIIAPAGLLLTKVLYTKKNSGKTFVIVDAAMNDLMRPSLYGAVHPITPVVRDGARGKHPGRPDRADIVGPVCETGDCLLRDWPLGEVNSGDILAIWTTGAYGMSLASNYNARCRASEVLVGGHRATLIRRRETQADLLRTDLFARSTHRRY
jgi:diaminopimelate decarboxylase